MLDLLYWNTQLILLIGELAVMLLVIVLPPLWAIGAVLELIDKIRLRKKLYKTWRNYSTEYIEKVYFLDKDKRKDKIGVWRYINV